MLLLLLLLLCCHVVKLGKAKEKDKKKTPQKSGSTSGHFLQDKLWLHVPKLLFFFGCFVVVFFGFFLVARKHYKNRVF